MVLRAAAREGGGAAALAERNTYVAFVRREDE